MSSNILVGWDGEMDMETVMGGLKEAMHKRLGWPLVKVSIHGTVVNVEGIRKSHDPKTGYTIIDSNYTITYDVKSFHEIYGRIGLLLDFDEQCMLRSFLVH